jgi:hypothetical protein
MEKLHTKITPLLAQRVRVLGCAYARRLSYRQVIQRVILPVCIGLLLSGVLVIAFLVLGLMAFHMPGEVW